MLPSKSSRYTPAPLPSAWDYADVAVLALAVALVTVLALRARSRRWIWVAMLGSLVYFGFWRGGCVCSIGAIQNVALGLADAGYVVPIAVAALLLVPLASTLLFGRTFCAGACPLGALQDLVLVRPVRVPPVVDHALGLLAYVYLGAAVLFAATDTAFLICEYDPFVSLFRLVPLAQPGQTMNAFGGSTTMLAVGAGSLVMGLFIGRPYCRWLCPLGAVLRPLARVSKWHVAITPEECVQCRLCEDACPFGAIRKPNASEPRAARRIDRRRLALLLVAVPMVLGAGAALGWGLGKPFARMNHTVQVADRVHAEDAGLVEGTDNLSDAFYQTRRPKADLYAEARAVEKTFAWATALFGAWVGLVVGAKLVHLSIHRTRTDYEPDRAACVSCGRCFAYCPVERKRRKSLQEGGPSQ